MVSPYGYLARMVGGISEEVGSICGIVEIKCGAVKERKDDLKHPSSLFFCGELNKESLTANDSKYASPRSWHVPIFLKRRLQCWKTATSIVLQVRLEPSFQNKAHTPVHFPRPSHLT